MVEKEYTDLVLPKASYSLFMRGKLDRVPTDDTGRCLSGFEEAEEGDSVDKFDLETADTSQVENMNHIFYRAESFNQDISSWDVSNVTTMNHMFANAKSFNQDISGWDVNNVITMISMFLGARSFNQDISRWDVSNVTTMNSMFEDAGLFNQDISSWDVSNVTTMISMFRRAESFNQDISGWNVSNVDNMSHMFTDTRSFNQDISTWSWDLSCINEAFTDDKFEELCEQMKYDAFENQELHKLDESKIKILLENNIISGETALSYSI